MRFASIAAMPLAFVLAGCASLAIDDNHESLRQFAQQRLGSEVKWLTSEEARKRAQAEVETLLAKPLAADDAVRIALAYSPALQSMLFDAAGLSADATQSGRLPNPVFTFERLVRNEGGRRELEIERALGFSLLDVMLLPLRASEANARQQQLRTRAAADVVQTVVDTRHAWVRAVAARQSAAYFEQVQTAAEASAELARRMQAVGNFSVLQRAREQAFYADATAQLARARHAATAARESLVRALGLDEEHARALLLPDRLPDLPQAPRDERELARFALEDRLDMQMARAELDATARAQGLTRITGWINGLHLAGISKSETDLPRQKGFELELQLPLFDSGSALRAGGQARYMAALNRTTRVGIDAASQLRESYSAYRTAHDLALHYRDEVVPLRKAIADEMLLLYNGNLASVFELLADSREQVGTVNRALEALRDFWLADSALQAALLGRPASAQTMEPMPAAAAGSAAH